MNQNHIFSQPYPVFPYAYRQHPGAMGPQPGTPGFMPGVMGTQTYQPTQTWWQWLTSGSGFGPSAISLPYSGPFTGPPVFTPPYSGPFTGYTFPQTYIQPTGTEGYILIGPPHY
ncbi:hypothetical protein ACIQYG_06405 [Peribacillus sp. NPDC096622]|uniref:hypothetical protein n=1 Tax=Peribacillus sp. NPDC096622 TaxID=3364396 RepID=UPI0037F922B9